MAVVAASVMSTAVLMTPADANDTNSGGDFVPLTTAVKAYESASNTGGAATAGIGAAATATFPVIGVGAVPDDGVSAVLVQLTGLTPTASTYVSVWATGRTSRTGSVLNLAAGSAGMSTTVPVPVGNDGTISLFNAAGTTKFLATIEGYYLEDPSSSATGFVPTTPTWIVDTRTGLNVTKAKVAAKGSVTVKLTGGVVPTGARSIFLDAIAVGATAVGTVADSSGSKISYAVGTTSSPMLGVPNASGQVTFTNGGSAAIDLVLSVHGYTAATTSVGSGFRVVQPVRIANSLSIAAGATVDVQVAGAGGLPLRGIKAVPLAIAVAGSTTTGYLRIWPSTSTEPSPSTLNVATDTRASHVITPLGTTGAVRVRNGTTSVVRVYIDVMGLIGDPLGSVAPVDSSPTALVQMPGSGTDPGPVEYAYTDGSGQLYHGYQGDPADFRNIQWTADPDQETYSGAPSLASLANGTVLAAAEHYDTDIYAVRTPTGPDWDGSFGDLGGSMSAPPTVAALPDGTGIIFAIDVDGSLWAYSFSASPLYWRRLSTAALTGTPTVSRLTDGLQITTLSKSGTVKTATYKNGVLSAWTDLGGVSVTERPAVVVDSSGKVRVVARQTDGSVITKMQSAADATFPSTWTRIGTLIATGAPAAALSAAGALVVLARNADGYVYESDETSARSNAWSSWLPVANQTEPSATDVSLTAITGSPDGWTWLGVYRTRDNSTRVIVPKPSAAARSAAIVMARSNSR